MSNNDDLKRTSSESALDAMESISSAAEVALTGNVDASVSSFASVNTFTDQSSQQQLRSINQGNRRIYENLKREPYLSRVRYLDEDDIEHVIFVTRFGSLPSSKHTLVNRNAPIGRLASLHPGDSQIVNFKGNAQELVVLEKMQVEAKSTEDLWDSNRNIYSLEDFASERLGSLREFLALKKSDFCLLYTSDAADE